MDYGDLFFLHHKGMLCRMMLFLCMNSGGTIPRYFKACINGARRASYRTSVASPGMTISHAILGRFCALSMNWSILAIMSKSNACSKMCACSKARRYAKTLQDNALAATFYIAPITLYTYLYQSIPKHWDSFRTPIKKQLHTISKEELRLPILEEDCEKST